MLRLPRDKNKLLIALFSSLNVTWMYLECGIGYCFVVRDIPHGYRPFVRPSCSSDFEVAVIRPLPRHQRAKQYVFFCAGVGSKGTLLILRIL